MPEGNPVVHVVGTPRAAYEPASAAIFHRCTNACASQQFRDFRQALKTQDICSIHNHGVFNVQKIRKQKPVMLAVSERMQKAFVRRAKVVIDFRILLEWQSVPNNEGMQFKKFVLGKTPERPVQPVNSAAENG